MLLGTILDPLGSSWGGLGTSWGGLGALLDPPGQSWEAPGVVLGASWGALGRSWGALGRSKIDRKIDPKLDSKTGRIATEKMALELRLSMFQSLINASGNQMRPLEKAITSAIDMISSY